MAYKTGRGMKMLITIVVTALLAWLTSSVFAWWMIAVIPFLVAVVWQQRPGRGFLNGLLSIGILWLLLILKTDAANDQLLSQRMSQLFGLGHGLFVAVNILLGALVGGLGGWSGASMWRIYKRDKRA